VRATCLQLSASIIERTPVDTGRAKGNWQASIGRPELSVLDTEDKDGSAALAKVRQQVQDAPGSVFFLANNLPYIRRLEYDAWSPQAPAGMVRVTVQEFEQALAKAVRDVT
jgi:hypothetical protein